MAEWCEHVGLVHRTIVESYEHVDWFIEAWLNCMKMSDCFSEGWFNGVDYDSMIEESYGNVTFVYGRMMNLVDMFIGS